MLNKIVGFVFKTLCFLVFAVTLVNLISAILSLDLWRIMTSVGAFACGTVGIAIARDIYLEKRWWSTIAIAAPFAVAAVLTLFGMARYFF